MCFTETWLKERTPDSVVVLDRFHLVRADRCSVETGKSKGGGLALFVNERWCCPGQITVKEKLFNKDIELLAVGMRPYYLPREFSYVISILVYIPPSANVSNACKHINTVTARMQSKYPQALIIILGDFNQASLHNILPTFTQYVDCDTRDYTTLDLLYANVKNAYGCSPLPPLERSDHNLVYIRTVYVPAVRKQPPTTRTVKAWSDSVYGGINGLF